MFCQKCGTQNEEVARFCANCGETLDLGGTSSNQGGAAPVAAPVEAPVGAGFYPTPEPAKAVNPKKLITIAIAAVVAIIVVVLGFNLVKGLLGGGKVNYEKHPVVYNRDGDIMVQLAGKANPEKAYELGASKDIADIYVTDDGKYIFYGDDEEENGEYDLYYRKASDTKGKSAKEIDTGVTDYSVSPNGKMVVYQKGDKLYISNLKKSEQIDKDVMGTAIVGNGKYLIYSVSDGDSGEFELYLCKMNLKADPVKIDDEVTNLWIPSDEETGKEAYKGVLYYEKDGDLYYVKNGKNPEKVLSDVDSVRLVGEKAIATTIDETTYSFDEVYDDNYERREGMEDVDIKYDDNWEPVLDDDGNYVYVKNEYKIFTVNGKKAKELEGKFTNVYLYLQYAKNEDDEYFVIKKDGSLISIGEIDEDADVAEVSDDEKYVYIIEDIDDEADSDTYDCGTLKRYKLTSKGLGAEKEIASDVEDVEELDNGAIVVYTVDGDDQIFNVFYKDKYYEGIGENVVIVDDYGRCDKTIYFKDDVDTNDEYSYYTEGALMKYTLGKKEAKKIDDDVRTVEVRSDNMVYYIADWDDDDSVGTLFLAKGNGAPKVVDEEVSSIWW